MKIEKFEDIQAWQESRILTNIVYKASNSNKEFYTDLRFRGQITAASVSVMSNIAAGITRMRKAMKDTGLPLPKFEFTDFFTITFYRHKDDAKTVGKTVGKILALINENHRIIRKELSAKTGLTIRGVEWNLNKLKKEGILKRIGSAKGGYWKVV